MTAYLLVAIGACGVCFLAGCVLATWRAERRVSRPADNRPRPRTGAAGRGPGRAHHWPGHPLPPLAARTDDPTRLMVPVVTRVIAPSPEARRRRSLLADTTEIRPRGGVQ